MNCQKSNIVIIDCYGFIYRAYHTQPKMTNPEGQEVGTLYGFINMIIKILVKFHPSILIAVFDSPGENHRKKVYADYKANRPSMPSDLKDQIDLIIEATSVMNIPIIKQHATEADDIIASCVKKFASNKNPVIVVSSDKDLMQLVDSHTQVFNPGTERIFSEKEVKEKFHVTPLQLKDYLAIVGDSSDNIPGVKGIGQKGASDLIQSYGDLDNIYANLENINKRHKKLLEEGKRNAYLSRELVTLVEDLDISMLLKDLDWKLPDQRVLSEFLIKHQFRSLFNRVNKMYDSGSLSESNYSNDNDDPKVVTSIEQLIEFINSCNKTGILSIFVEESKTFLRIYLSSNSKQCYVVNINTNSEEKELSYSYIAPIIECLFDESILKITYDIKNTLHIFKRYWNFGAIAEIGTKINAVQDLLLMYYALETRNRSNNDVKSIISHIIGLSSSLNLSDVVLKFHDAFYKMHSMLFEIGCLDLYYNFDLPLANVILEMEDQGILLDINILQDLKEEVQNSMKKLEGRIFTILGKEFNLASPRQVSEVLFEGINFPQHLIKMSKTGGYSTNSTILQSLSNNGSEVAELILQWRKYHKIKTTYIEALLKHKNKDTNRIHSIFSQTTTNTGRLNSVSPNLQNIPIKTNLGNQLRGSFISPEGYSMISADYSQMELRLLSHIAKVDSMIEAFQANLDIHKETAANVFKIPVEEVKQDQRNKAKAINFGIIYGISPFGLAKQMKIDIHQSQQYINSYFEKYNGILDYMNYIKDFAHKFGYVNSMFNRRCSILNINSKDHNLRQFAERAAINAPIQASASDIMRMVMIRIMNQLQSNKVECNLLLQIHDELLFECKNEFLEKAQSIIKFNMEHMFEISVPLSVKIAVTNSLQI